MVNFVKRVWSNQNNGPITPEVFNHLEDGIEEAINLASSSGQSSGLESRIASLEDAVADLSYVALALSSSTISPASAALGSTVSSFEVNYSFNKVPATVTLKQGSTTLQTIAAPSSATGRISMVNQTITSDTTFTLSGIDERDHAASSTIKIEFMNYVYYGAANAPQSVDSAFVTGLASNVLSKTKARTVTINATGSKYIWYAIPSRLGTPVFTVGGFEGGFSLAGTISVTNGAGYAENYAVYKSDNAGLGSTKVVIS